MCMPRIMPSAGREGGGGAYTPIRMHEAFLKNSIDYYKCMQHTGLRPVTHHTTPSHRIVVTIFKPH